MNPKEKLQEIATHFHIGKTAAAWILEDGKKLRNKSEFFKNNCKTKRAR